VVRAHKQGECCNAGRESSHPAARYEAARALFQLVSIDRRAAGAGHRKPDTQAKLNFAFSSQAA
jgi:hypothetical protein